MTHINKGKPFPLGSSLTSKGVNFSLIATNAEYVEILLFEKEDSIFPKTILKLDQNHNTGPYWHAEIKNLNEGCIYAYRVKQKNNEINNNYEKKVLLDPCSRGITGWGSYKRENALKTQENTNSCLKSVVCNRKLFRPFGGSVGSKQKIGSNSIVVMPSSWRYGIFFKNFLKQLSSLSADSVKALIWSS